MQGSVISLKLSQCFKSLGGHVILTTVSFWKTFEINTIMNREIRVIIKNNSRHS